MEYYQILGWRKFHPETCERIALLAKGALSRMDEAEEDEIDGLSRKSLEMLLVSAEEAKAGRVCLTMEQLNWILNDYEFLIRYRNERRKVEQAFRELEKPNAEPYEEAQAEAEAAGEADDTAIDG